MESRAVSSSHPTLFGRAEEQRALLAGFDRSRAGHGQLVLVSGEAGIGKTALVETIVSHARDLEDPVVIGRCYDLTTTPPFGPWIEVLQGIDETAGTQNLDATDGRLPLQVRLLDALGSLSRSPTPVVLLEDIHWADGASLDLLRKVSREIVSLPLLLVATYRDDEVTRRHPLHDLLPVIVREAPCERISLRALVLEDIEDWISACYSMRSEDQRALVNYVASYSDGNPLFISELLRSLEDNRVIVDDGSRLLLDPGAGSSVPVLLRQVLERRLATVGERAREVLRVGAVIGQRLPHRLWGRVAGLDPEAFEAALDEAFHAGILVPDRSRGDLAFSHALVREVLYQEILPSRRQMLHRSAGEALLALDDPDPDEVAHHLRLAGDPRAHEWLTRAGDRAHRGEYALRTAADRFEAALALTGTRQELLETRGWILIRLAMVLRFSEPNAGLHLVNDAVDIADRLGDDAMAAAAVWIRGVLRFLAGGNGVADFETGDAALEALDDANRERLRRQPFGRILDSVSRRSGLVWWYGSHARPSDALNARTDLSDSFPDGRYGRIDRAIAETGEAIALAALGRAQEAREVFERARNVFEEFGYSFYVTTLTAYELYLLDIPFFTDHLSERSQKADRVHQYASRDLQELVEVPPDVATSPLALIEGRWELFDSIADAVRANPSSFFVWNYAIPTLASHARYIGQPERAMELIRMLLPFGPATDITAAGVPMRSLEGLRLGAELALDAGNLVEASAWISAHDRGLEWSEYQIGRSAGRLLQARYEWLSGSRDVARREAEQALATASEPRQPLELLAAHRFLAELATDGGRHEDARWHIGEAIDLAEACAAPFERALALLVLARLDHAVGNREQARKELQESIGTAEQLHAMPLIRQAGELLLEIEESAATALISPRELEVLALVAEGMTDREVAEHLYISPRTVNQHLRSIYNKLGVGSRAAATRRAIELRLLT